MIKNQNRVIKTKTKIITTQALRFKPKNSMVKTNGRLRMSC